MLILSNLHFRNNIDSYFVHQWNQFHNKTILRLLAPLISCVPERIALLNK